MRQEVPSWCWRITAIVAVALLIATFVLVGRAREESVVGITAYLAGRSLMVNLHEGPSQLDKTVAFLERGTPVLIKKVDNRDDHLSWYYVEEENAEGGNAAGWVDALHLSFDPP